MSIEQSSVSSAPKAVGHGGHVPGKGKAGSVADADASPSGGFASVLSALDSGLVDPSLGDSSASTQTVVDTTVDLSTMVPTGNANFAALDNQLPAVDLSQANSAMILAQGLPGGTGGRQPCFNGNDTVQLSTIVGTTKGAPGAALVQPDPALLAQAVAASANGQYPRSGPLEAPQPGTTIGPVKAAVLDIKTPALAGEVLLPFSATPQSLKQRVDLAVQDGALTAVAGSAGRLKPSQSSLAATTALDGRNPRTFNVSDAATWVAPLAQAIVAAEGSERRAGEADRVNSKAVSSLLGSAPDGAWGQQSSVRDAQLGVTTAAPGPATAAPETFVAEQVSYWVSRDVQNAQLKLDGFGSNPVEVNISLHGNEAQVDFRSDQPEMRQILEGSASHLKDLLSRQGMVLSGISFGAASQQGANSERRNNPSEMRQNKMAPLMPAASQIAPAARSTSGRAVDLFV